MAEQRTRNPLFIFYLLVIYVLIQLGWWAFLLIDFHKDKIGMIAGEGAVFLILLTFGVIRIRRSFKAELEATRQQKNFLQSITHELKSPLSSIRLSLETMQKRDLTEEKQASLSHNAIQDVDRLNELVDNILLATRLEGGTLPLDLQQVDLSTFVTNLIEKFQQERNVTVETDVDEGLSWAVDRHAFASIVMNLLENAAKYAPNSPVRVTLQKTQEGLVLSVADKGPGISAGEKNKVFRKFYRIGDEEKRKTKGTGLGLYITKNMVEAHGGTIRIEDVEPQGCDFILVLKNE